MLDTPDPSSSRFGSPSRLEASSDGFFAIAITLLVLEIRPPTAEQATSAEL